MNKTIYQSRAAEPLPLSLETNAEEVYEVVLREAGGSTLKARVKDRVLYPRALAWNRLLDNDMGRRGDWEDEAKTWQRHGRKAIMHLAEAGMLSRRDALKFVAAAAKSGVIEVEMPWEGETKGWAARIFPWEELLALATKAERLKIGTVGFSVVRVLRGTKTHATTGKGVRFVVSTGAKKRGFNYEAEKAAIGAALQDGLEFDMVGDLADFSESIAPSPPRAVHLVLDYEESSGDQRDGDAERISRAVADSGVELAVFSFCHTGARVAPLTVAKGVKFALGFHGVVTDGCLPVFFGAFYREWEQSDDVLKALRAGQAANASQGGKAKLGVVTVWSAVRLIKPITTEPPRRRATRGLAPPSAEEQTRIPDSELNAALIVTCELEKSLNYSMLHNSRTGIFRKFFINKVRTGKVPVLEVKVVLDAGTSRPAECLLFVRFKDEAGMEELAGKVVLPLGAEVLRQRGEAILGTVCITVSHDGKVIWDHLKNITLLPSDEWRDDESGRHLLPSFVFPRDPAVRETLTAAQPFLRALSDNPIAGFDGYQAGFHNSVARAVTMQTRALWSALQFTLRLDYASPPPTYSVRSQRLRTPEEVLRSRRATCIETSLLMASCWEHVGIHPVIFLIKNHAFAGCWLDVEAWKAFLSESISQANTQAPLSTPEEPPPNDQNQETAANRKDGEKIPWVFRESCHLKTILNKIEIGALLPLETTCIPKQDPYAKAVQIAETLLQDLSFEDFDGMIDVETAREHGVTPLSIIYQGVVA